VRKCLLEDAPISMVWHLMNKTIIIDVVKHAKDTS